MTATGVGSSALLGSFFIFNMHPKKDSWDDFFDSQKKLLDETRDMIRDAERRANAIKQETVKTETGTTHRISADTWSSRCRLFGVFWRVAWSILLKGRASMRVRTVSSA